VFVLAVNLAWFVLGCTPERKSVLCPADSVADDARATLVLDTLRKTPQGAHLEERARDKHNIAICFSPRVVSVVTDEGTLLVDDKLDTKEAAARVGHLLEHVAKGPPLSPRAGETCDQAVLRALSSEAEALSLELDLRRSLALTSPRILYDFEADYSKTNESDRKRLVLDYLRSHPQGGPGLDALAAGYQRRCREGLP